MNALTRCNAIVVFFGGMSLFLKNAANLKNDPPIYIYILIYEYFTLDHYRYRWISTSTGLLPYNTSPLVEECDLMVQLYPVVLVQVLANCLQSWIRNFRAGFLRN